MADKITGKTILGAISDFIILALLIGGAGFGGYYVGINQKLAPIQLVPAGTPGAKTLAQLGLAPKDKQPGQNSNDSDSVSAATSTGTAPASSVGTKEAPADEADKTKNEKLKYWLASSGADYCGYSITVKVNGTPVDAFFGPDKIIDVTKLVHKGNNTITFEAKALGEQYNKHTGDSAYSVTVRLIKGPHVQETYNSKDMLMSYSRTAADTDDNTETRHFTAGN